MLRILSSLLLSNIFLCTNARTFTVYNGCPFTVWPAMFTDLNVAPNVPNHPTGWMATSYTSVSFEVPDNWQAGRIWGRRDCNFTVPTTSPNSCATGGCNGGLLCDPNTGTGVPPATVAEWTLQGSGNLDFYDVSLVDGYDLPMRIDNNVGCPVADCPVDLGPNCPAQLKGPLDSTGFPIGCKSACDADLDGDPTNSPNCCTGQFSTAATCPSSGVEFYSYFKGSCPNAYAYAFDEGSGTALWTCSSSLNANYTLTFCPTNTTSVHNSGGAVTTPYSSIISTGPTGTVSGDSSSTSAVLPIVLSNAPSSKADLAVVLLTASILIILLL